MLAGKLGHASSESVIWPELVELVSDEEREVLCAKQSGPLDSCAPLVAIGPDRQYTEQPYTSRVALSGLSLDVGSSLSHRGNTIRGCTRPIDRPAGPEGRVQRVCGIRRLHEVQLPEAFSQRT